MIEETAVVQGVQGEWAEVITGRRSGCHQCDEATSCSTSVLAKLFGDKSIALRLHSSIPLQVGDEVLIGIKENTFLGLTCLVYLLPLCGLLLFSVLGGYIEQHWQFNHEGPTVVMAVLGFAVTYYGIKKFIRNYLKPEKINPVILKKI
jgi:sigma-E factor negative regulatory protein RseC|tara:strand:+ start:95 stop:538 length:444 start_codon:yes stop_codon:yes gene_type:complete